MLAIFMQVVSMNAHAEVHVTGETNDMKVETRGATVEELLIALSRTTGLQYRSSADLNRFISGTYAGSLSQVLARLLRGYNFIIETAASGTMVVVYESGTAHGHRADLIPMTASSPSSDPARAPRHAPPNRANGNMQGGHGLIRGHSNRADRSQVPNYLQGLGPN